MNVQMVPARGAKLTKNVTKPLVLLWLPQVSWKVSCVESRITHAPVTLLELELP